MIGYLRVNMRILWLFIYLCLVFQLTASSLVKDSIQKETILDCCDTSGFLEASSLTDCDFELFWEDHRRFVIKDESTPSEPITTPAPVHPYLEDILPVRLDLKILPQNCTIEECIFKNLQIVSHTGSVDMDAFTRLLDNMTRDYPEWISAKARVITTCLTRPLSEYEGECEINKVLACTFDVLSENCPYHKDVVDTCKNQVRNSTEAPILCQVTSSTLRAKKRRRLCEVPSLVKDSELQQCGVNSLTLMKYIRRLPKLRRSMIRRPKQMSSYLRYVPSCKPTTPSSKCVMTAMGVLNKYSFMDYFKMKDLINKFTAGDGEWGVHRDAYLNVFTSPQLYGEHCTSQRKLLNIIDTMVMTCPQSKRKTSQKCNIFFDTIRSQAIEYPRKLMQSRYRDILSSLRDRYHPKPFMNPRGPFQNSPIQPDSKNSNLNIEPRKIEPSKRYFYSPYGQIIIYDSNVDLINRKSPSPIHTYSSATPLVLLPVYKRQPQTPVLPA